MNPAELIEEQRQTLHTFWKIESQREQSEKKEGEKLAAATDATRNQAEADTSWAKDYVEDAHQTQAAAYEALQQVGLSPPKPRSWNISEENAPPLTLLKNAVYRTKVAANQVTEGTLEFTETQKKVKIRRIVVAIGISILALAIVINHLLVLPSSVPPVVKPLIPYKSPSPTRNPLSRFQVGRQWAIDWQSLFHYQGILRIQQQIGTNQYLGRITVSYLIKNKKITVSMDGLLTIQGKNVVIRCSNPSVSWWDTDDFYMEWDNDTMTGYNIDKKGRRGTAVFRFVGSHGSEPGTTNGKALALPIRLLPHRGA